MASPGHNELKHHFAWACCMRHRVGRHLLMPSPQTYLYSYSFGETFLLVQAFRIDSYTVHVVFRSWTGHECISLSQSFVLIRVAVPIRTEFVVHSAYSHIVLIDDSNPFVMFVRCLYVIAGWTCHERATKWHESIRIGRNVTRTNTKFLEFHI